MSEANFSQRVAAVGVNASQAVAAFKSMAIAIRKMKLDWIALEMALMRSKYGPLRYLMPRWWELCKKLKETQP